MDKEFELDWNKYLELVYENSTNMEIIAALFAFLSKDKQDLIVQGLEQIRDDLAVYETQPVREIREQIYERRVARLKQMQSCNKEPA